MLSIQTNVNSMNAQENLRVTNQFQGRTISRLTSGFRINESGDDAAGLAVANKYRSDVTELQQGVRNANDGLSTMQIIDGGLNNISKMLDRLKTLATQSASATFTGDRATLNQEFQSLLIEIDRQAENIGLGDTATTGDFNAKSMAVYVGGGKSQTNSQVTVNLSQKSDRVNAAALSVKGMALNGTLHEAAGTAYAASATDMVINGTTISVDLTDSAVDVAWKINNDATLKAAGVTAVLSADNSTFSLYDDAAITIGTAGGWTGAASSTAVASAETKATTAITAISAAVSRLGKVQGKIGTGQNQLQYAISLAQSQITSFSAAESRIRDADVAQEAANLTKAQVLQQASLAALAQANSAPQAVLSLLRG